MSPLSLDQLTVSLGFAEPATEHGDARQSDSACRTDDRLSDLATMAIRIRALELCLLNLFKQGLVFGTVHTCVGQEFCAAALHPHLRPGTDAFFATHRGHGHYLAHGGPADALLAEVMGRQGALCLGRGGTQNLRYERFFSAGIQGGSAPIGTGFAHAARQRGESAIAVVQLGDGTLGEGTLYEAFTFAALLKAPILFLAECNGWAQSTDVSRTTPGDILKRAAGFGLETCETDDRDPLALYEHLGRVVRHVRAGNPFFQVIRTRRLLAHSKGDDNRPDELIARQWTNDPLTRLLERDERLQRIDADARRHFQDLAQAVAERNLLQSHHGDVLPPIERRVTAAAIRAADPAGGRIAEELNRGLHEVMQSDPHVHLLGEDLLDPYGGAFKVARGLSTRFPGRVFSTPIAEAAIVGVANGMALAGLRPVAEIMFADFVTLAADQLINFAAKFHYMYGQEVRCPLTLRLVSGGGRGYGPTHSQCLERLFCGIPGLRVVALSQRHDPASLLKRVIADDDGPTIFVENKSLYSLRPLAKPPLDLQPNADTSTDADYPPLCFQPSGNGSADVTLVTYGGMTPACEAAMQRAIEELELRFDYIVLTQLWPLDLDAVVASAKRTRRLVVVEESAAEFGVGSAVVSAAAQQVTPLACRAVGAGPTPIPAVRHLEDQVLPSADSVFSAIAAVANSGK